MGSAGEAAFVEGDGRGGAIARVQQTRMQERGDAERDDGVDEPGHRAPAEKQEQGAGNAGDRQARITETRVPMFLFCQRRLACRQARAVFRLNRHWHLL